MLGQSRVPVFYFIMTYALVTQSKKAHSIKDESVRRSIYHSSQSFCTAVTAQESSSTLEMRCSPTSSASVEDGQGLKNEHELLSDVLDNVRSTTQKIEDKSISDNASRIRARLGLLRKKQSRRGSMKALNYPPQSSYPGPTFSFVGSQSTAAFEAMKFDYYCRKDALNSKHTQW